MERKIIVLFFALWLCIEADAEAQNFWQPLNGPSGAILSLIINSSEHIFAGTDGGGVFRSTDNGQTWTPVTTGLTHKIVYTFAINSGGDIFAGTDGGVFLLKNNVESWMQVFDKPTIALAINSSGHIFAGTNANGMNLFRSTDNGNSWESLYIAGGFVSPQIFPLAINSSDYIYAGIKHLNNRLLQSTDNGVNWTTVSPVLNPNFILSIAINSSDQVFVGTNGSGVFRFTNNGGSWEQLNNGLTNTDILSLAISSSGHVFTGTNGGGVFRSMDNGESWTQINTGLTNIFVNTIAINSNGYIFAGTKGGMFRSVQSPMVTTNSATNVNSTSATLNGTVNPNGLSTTVKFEFGLTNSYGREVTATPSPLSGTNSFSVSAELNDLSPGTEYHYRVVATNSNGTTNGADQTFTTLGAVPTVITNSTTKIDSTFAMLNGMVNPNGLSTTVNFEYGKTLSYDSTITATQSPVNGTDSVSVSAEITGLSPGTEYHYRAVATNSLGTTTGSDQTFITYSSTFKLNTTLSFQNRANAFDYPANDYRILGLPGASNQSVKDFLSGEQNKDWQVFWDNGGASNFFVEFREGPEFLFSVGRSFWIINKGPLNIDTTVRSAPLNAVQEAEILLPHLGWNLITNPYTSSIEWSKIQSVNGISHPIYSYNGSYSTPSSFDPYVGYYFYNDPMNSKGTLKIPYSLLFSGPSVTEYVNPIKWRVNITLSSGDFIDKINSFGVASEASLGLDHFDFRKPRAIATIPTVAFNRPAWDANYSTFATDIRPEFEESESWDFEVRSTQRAASQLVFSSIVRIPNQFEIYLIDEGRARTVNLREDSLYNFTPVAELSKFRVVVGKKEMVQEKLNSVALPKEFELGHNYPNPFNSTTTISVAVPFPSDIRLKVYNILGEEVKTLYDGTLVAGRYWFNWDGRNAEEKNVATGVYLYRLSTSMGVALSGKMILMR